MKGDSCKGTGLPKAIATTEGDGSGSDGNDAGAAKQQSDRHDIGKWSGSSDEDSGAEAALSSEDIAKIAAVMRDVRLTPSVKQLRSQAIRSRARRASAPESTVSSTLLDSSVPKQAVEDGSHQQAAQIDQLSATATSNYLPAILPLDSRGLPMWPRAGGKETPADAGSSGDTGTDAGSSSDSDDVGTRADFMS